MTDKIRVTQTCRKNAHQQFSLPRAFQIDCLYQQRTRLGIGPRESAVAQNGRVDLHDCTPV